MSMFDGFSDLSGNRKLPTGTTPADVVGVVRDEEKGTVKLKFKFRAYDVTLSQTHYMKKKDGSSNDVGASILAKQIRNAGFKDVKTGPELAAALDKLEGTPVVINITNKKGTDFQDFYILERGKVERGVADIEDDAAPADDDDIPF